MRRAYFAKPLPPPSALVNPTRPEHAALMVARAAPPRPLTVRHGCPRDNSPMPVRPKNLDMNQLAKRILDEATGDEPKTEAPAPKNEAAVELGRLGGKKGGDARKTALTPEQRSEIAKKAAAGRWTKSNLE